ncbi:alpha/beta-hydrolase [Morchella conica CCBAS932]|uniref:Alpha/beta-hydrolase n=1 Tax=Morchella conica CCBAS932 TaxID=1392247 RepID=A0A3N4KFP9_9PEZI|nr:alpha/beta-hydrolase [Morchella conica CCBAS932]
MKMKTTILRLRLRPRPAAGPNLYRQLRNHSTVPTHPEKKLTEDPRLKELGRTLSDEFSTIRENYRTPKNPIVLCHGLLGFNELRLAGQMLPGIAYWRGITEVLRANGVEVITTTVPASGSIEVRAKALAAGIEESLKGRSVNLIGHSMVLSLTTVATPHRGSSFADYILDLIGKERLPSVYAAVESLGLETGAFAQLTTRYMEEKFNKLILDDPSVRYFSYGAMAKPGMMSVFRQSHRIIEEKEGPNDGLVSVRSAQWGTYKGTLVGPTHLGIINWTNRVWWMLTGNKATFNAIAFYCDIADMLAEEGL